MAYSTAPASDHKEPSVRRQNVSSLCQSGSMSETRVGPTDVTYGALVVRVFHAGETHQGHAPHARQKRAGWTEQVSESRALPRRPAEPPGGRSYLRATANSLDRVKRSLLLLGNMAARMSVNRPEGAKTENRSVVRRFAIIEKQKVRINREP